MDNTSKGYTVIYAPTDKWGRTNTKFIQYCNDKIAPSWISWIDANRGAGEAKTQTTVNNIWYKSETLYILGEFIETGSGVRAILYWV